MSLKKVLCCCCEDGREKLNESGCTVGSREGDQTTTIGCANVSDSQGANVEENTRNNERGNRVAPECNPRNKCVLKPGHSHIDWIRLSNSKDLTGLGALAGQLKVTLDELAKHNKITDGWLAINGKVFNVTAYLPFHPGGVDELTRGLGTDATKLFYEIHSWVNWESLLKKCYVGPLVPNYQLEPLVKSPVKELKDPFPPVERTEPNLPISTKPDPCAPPRWFPKQEESPAVQSFHADHEMELSTDTSYHQKIPSKKSNMPKFEWSQKSQTICIAFSDHPQHSVVVEATRGPGDAVVDVTMRYEQETISNHVTFEGGVQWPCSMRVWEEDGKVELTFKKAESKLWMNFGILKQVSKPTLQDLRKMDYVVASKREVAKDVFLFELRMKNEDTVVYAPLGSYYLLLWPKYQMSKPYTPIPAPTTFFPKVARATYGSDKIHLMIKRYVDGTVSKYVCDTEEGSILEVSMPFLGQIRRLNQFEKTTRFLFIAAGTGLTPMLRLMTYFLQRRNTKVQKMVMVMVNHGIEYTPFLEEFLALDDEFERSAKAADPPGESLFSLKFFLREFDETSRNDPRFQKMGEGNKFQDQLVKVGEEFMLQEDWSPSRIFVCGPKKFNSLCQFALRDANISYSDIYVIEG